MDGMTINHIVSIDHGSNDGFDQKNWHFWVFHGVFSREIPCYPTDLGVV